MKQLIRFVFLALLLPSFASLLAGDPSVPSEDAALAAAYQQALEAAKFPDASKISKNLTPLNKANKKLIFNDQGLVLMTTFTKAQYYGPEYVKGYSYKLYGESWLTAAPYVQEFCKDYKGQNLLLRIQQLLGLPPKTESHNDSVVSFWVSPSMVFRPCADPEVLDSECLVTLSGDPFVNGTVSWAKSKEMSLAFVDVNQQHLDWMASNWSSRYTSTELYSRYPWTALGYTYDWGNPESSVGLSEYVSLGGTPVIFESIEALDSYCGR